MLKGNGGHTYLDINIHPLPHPYLINERIRPIRPLLPIQPLLQRRSPSPNNAQDIRHKGIWRSSIEFGHFVPEQVGLQVDLDGEAEYGL